MTFEVRCELADDFPKAVCIIVSVRFCLMKIHFNKARSDGNVNSTCYGRDSKCIHF